MAFIYKYEDKNNNEVVYVGISRNWETLVKRFAQHRRLDDWARFDEYKIYYSETKTETDAQALEGHYIALYSPKYNTAKSKWGCLSFAPPAIPWTEYNPHKAENLQTIYKQERELYWARLWDMYSAIEELQRKWESLKALYYDLEKKEGKLRRKAVREFLGSGYSCTPEVKELLKAKDKDRLYELYGEEEVAYKFANSEELWEAIEDLAAYGALYDQWVGYYTN